TAESAEKGLELLLVWTFQVAFLDQRLPGMEGVLLGEYLRRSNPHMVIALVTGEDDTKLEKRVRELGVTFIAKPFEPDAIVGVLDTYLEIARVEAELRSQRAAPDFEPPIGRYADELTDTFGIPKIPDRVAERLVATVQRCLHNLRSKSRYTERERVV